MQTNLIIPTTSKEPSLFTREVCTARVSAIKNFLMILWQRLCLNLFSQGEWKCLADPMASCWMVNCRLIGLSTSELLYSNFKIKLQLIRARSSFIMISDNHKVSLGNVDCSLYTRPIALKGDYHQKRMEMLAFTPVEFKVLETLAKTFIIPARQNQFIRENIFNKAPVRRIAIALNTNSAFTGSCTENAFWYQKFDLRGN